MLYFLLILLLFLTALAFNLGNKDILFPWFIVCASFTFCTFLASVYMDRLELPMHLNTIMIMISAILCFGIGAYISNGWFSLHVVPNRENIGIFFDVKQKYISLIIIIFFIIMYFNYCELYKISHLFNDSNDFSVMLRTMIENINYGNVQVSKFYTIRMIFSQAITFIFLFGFLYNMIFLKKINLKLLFPIFIYIPLILLTAGRQDFLYLTLFLFITFSILLQYKLSFNNKTSFFIISSMIISGIVFYSLFYVGGLISGKIPHSFSPFFMLSLYAGTNIPAFDVFVNFSKYTDNTYIGMHTLIPIYSNLRKIGVHLPELNGYIKTFIDFNGYSTNVYTSLRRYIQDYGYVGCFLIMFGLGVMYTSFYNYIKYQNKNLFFIIMYAAYCYPFFLFCREETFMTTVLSMRTVVTIGVMFVLFKLLFRTVELEVKK
jgi:oligosaccharide repeat unit polymerase